MSSSFRASGSYISLPRGINLMSQDLLAEPATPNLPVHASEHARLPLSYKNAKAALAKCTTIDECRRWQDKAAALASYALMAKENDLFTLARRVQLRWRVTAGFC
jgi:hypothetical protein